MKTRILVGDNVESVVDDYAAIIEAAGNYQVFKAYTPNEAIEILNIHRIHIAIIDIRFQIQWDPDDDSGLNVLGAADETVSKIAMTVLPPSPEIVKKIIKMSTFFYRLKSSPLDLIGEIEDRLNQQVKINFSLKMLPQNSNIANRLVEEVEHVAELVDLTSVLTKAELVEEIEELIRKIYWRYPSIIYMKSSHGRSGTGVVFITKKNNDGIDFSSIIKFDTRSRGKAHRESENFDKYVQAVSTRTQKTAQIFQTKNFEAIEYTLAEGDFNHIAELYEEYPSLPAEKVNEIITRVFEEIMSKWFAANYRPTQQSVKDFYIEQWCLDKKQERILDSIALISKSSQSTAPLQLSIQEKSIKIGSHNLEIPNPYHFAFQSDFEWPPAIFYKICHGDLNCRNIITNKKDYFWLIDFYFTGFGHQFQDFAKIESNLKHEMTDCINIRALFEMEYSLVTPNDLTSDLLIADNNFDQIKKAGSIIKHIRALANKHCQSPNQMGEYSIATLFNALQLLSWKSIHFGENEDLEILQKSHALLTAGLACWKISEIYGVRPKISGKTIR